MGERRTIEVTAAPGGWPKPWPNVAELAERLPSPRWSLIGGLMVQLHAVHHGIGITRPTNDVDIILHVEASRGVPAATADVLESLGYRLRVPVALRRTINARLHIRTGTKTTISVPDEFGALVLKAAAYQTDTRDRDRHLFDAAVLLCCIDDPYIERERFAGSDRRRLMLLAGSLSDDHPAWQRLPRGMRAEGQAALRLLLAPA